MGIESGMRFSVELQDEFDVRQMVPQAGIDGFA
jgi:hypothetical protein